MEYKIDGLTKRQVAILDIIWSMEDLDRVQSFIKALPERDRAEAHSLVTLITYEALEEMMPVFEEAGFPDAKEVIQRVR